jgi:hypothetical protein
MSPFSLRSASLAFALLLGSALPAAALEPSSGKVILTLSGKIADKNTPTGADFDLAMLEKLPQRTFTTQTPWEKHPVKFTGPLLRDVLAAAKASGLTLHAVAVNDYETTIPVSDAYTFDMILAYKMNDQPISARTKGPLFVVYPYDSKPELRDPVYANRSAWQLRLLRID